MSQRCIAEAAEAADVVRRQLAANAAPLRDARRGAAQRAPRAVVTCARGSSDHAATFAKYLIETHARVITASAAPSVSSVYDATPDLRDVLFIAISQSGKSPDLLARRAPRASAARSCVALCNTPDAPLVRGARITRAAARRAGDERRGDQVVHRLARRARAPRRRVDARSRDARRRARRRAGRS